MPFGLRDVISHLVLGARHSPVCLQGDVMAQKHVVVIGAGIVGVSTALWLQRAGCRVTLIDRDGPAAGTSYGNGGVLASIAVIPVTVPGLIGKAPGMLLDREQPLFLRWAYLPRLLPFLRRYLANARVDRVEKIASALSTLLHDATDQHRALADGTGAEGFIAPGDYLFAYRSRADFEGDAFGWGMRRKLGHPFEEMDAEMLADFDPALAGRFGFGVRCPGHGAITDPGAYVSALANAVEKAEGQFMQAEVTGFASTGQQAHAVETSAGPIEADEFVLTTGAWSGPMAKALGVQVPLESERGYHVEFHNPNLTLRAPMMVAAGKFVVTPMEGRLRCAGVVEFGGLNNPASKAPVALLKRQMQALFPELTYSHTSEWMGHRPATSDSLPLIGPSPALKNVYLGYGHQHVGLTAGPKTGRWLAQMITGAPVNEDLAAFRTDRTP